MKKRTPKPTKHERIAQSIAQEFAHQHTATIYSKRRVLEFELSEVERSIVMLSALLARKRELRATLAASIEGLTGLAGKRIAER